MEKITISKKISVSLLYILMGAGVIFFYDALKNFTPDKANWILWDVLYGIGMAYILNYKFEITTKHSRKKNDIS